MLKRLRTRWKRHDTLRALDVAQCDTFFFYGSLMERFRNFNRFVKKRVVSIEIGYCRGYLYNLPMGFPGLIVPDDPCPTLVAGEIMRFDKPMRMMKILDRLEHYIPGNEKRSIYLRRRMPVFTAAAGDDDTPLRTVEAWIYVYPERHLSYEHQRELRIECGQWKAFDGPVVNSRQLDAIFAGQQQCGNVLVHPALQRQKEMSKAASAYPCSRFCRNSANCQWINNDADS